MLRPIEGAEKIQNLEEIKEAIRLLATFPSPSIVRIDDEKSLKMDIAYKIYDGGELYSSPSENPTSTKPAYQYYCEVNNGGTLINITYREPIIGVPEESRIPGRGYQITEDAGEVFTITLEGDNPIPKIILKIKGEKTIELSEDLFTVHAENILIWLEVAQNKLRDQALVQRAVEKGRQDIIANLE